MILVTAFEPFGGEKLNPAEMILNLLPDRIGGSRIRKLLRSKHPDVGELRRLLPPELYDLVA